MPEEIESSSLNQTQTDSPQKVNHPLKKTFVVISLVTLIFIVGLSAFFYFNKPKLTEDKVITGLEVEKVTLGYKSLSGTYPTNSSPPITDDVSFNEALFEALTKISSNSTVEPALAERWTNPNSTTWRFELRDNIKFNTGQTLTADDVKYSFDQIIASAESEDSPWPSTDAVSTIKEVRVIDNKTLEIETTEPDPILLYRISGAYILSKEQVEKDGIENAAGTGAFKVIKFEKDKEAIIERRADYWGNKPKVKQIIFKVYDGDENLVEALNKGDIDYAKVGLANVNLGNNFLVKKIDEPRVVMLFFNFAMEKLNEQDNPLLNNDVRTAIKYSLDNGKLIKEASVSGRPANQFLTQSIVGYNSKIQSEGKNISKAKALLNSAGVTDFQFDVYTTPDRESVATSLANQLADSGIKVEVKVSETFGALVGLLFEGKAAAFIAGPTANDGGEYIEAIFKTEGEQNILSYSNPQIDEAISKTNNSFIPRERRESIETIVDQILQDNPVVPLYAVTNSYVIKENLDFSVNSYGDFIVSSINGRRIEKNSN